MPAGKLALPMILRHKRHQSALHARFRPRLVLKVDACGRILKHKIGPPGIARTPLVSAVLQEIEFSLQQFHQLMSVEHRHSPSISWPEVSCITVTHITVIGDANHECAAHLYVIKVTAIGDSDAL